MAATLYRNNGLVSDDMFRTVKYIGKTKGGQSITIELQNAFCNSNLEWAFAEKEDVVAALEFEACYDDSTPAASRRTVPASVSIDNVPASANDGIALGVGVFYIGETPVALTRGGGSYVEEYEYREINADGDRGKVKGRVELETVRAKLTMNVLTFFHAMNTFYPALRSPAG